MFVKSPLVHCCIFTARSRSHAFPLLNQMRPPVDDFLVLFRNIYRDGILKQCSDLCCNCSYIVTVLYDFCRCSLCAIICFICVHQCFVFIMQNAHISVHIDTDHLQRIALYFQLFFLLGYAYCLLSYYMCLLHTGHRRGLTLRLKLRFIFR